MKTALFNSNSLRNHPSGRAAAKILSAALERVEPAAAVKNFLRRDGTRIICGSEIIELMDVDNIFIIGAGKAAAPMATAAAEIIGNHLSGGVIVTKYGHTSGDSLPKKIEIIEAGHPIPDAAGVSGGMKISALLESLGERDLVICLISGGGSALLVSPAAGIDLDQVKRLTNKLLASGANIHEINTIRKHISKIKGGQLARLAFPAKLFTLILSDVVGDSLDVIASGPTVPDPTTFEDAVKIMKKFNIPPIGRLTEGAAGHHLETPKPGNPIFDNVQNYVIGTNQIAAEAARLEAERLGFQVNFLQSSLFGEAKTAGEWFARQFHNMPPSSVWIAGGETTVTLQGAPGKGGRNQEAALAAVPILKEFPRALMITFATDGGDGPTEAAGAVVTGLSALKAKSLGLDPGDYLERHDSYHFFKKMNDLIITGPTKTNVNDLWLLFS